MNNSTLEIGSQFYFVGDWRTPSGKYEVVAFTYPNDPDFQVDCRRIADNNNANNLLYKGWWPENIQRLCKEKKNGSENRKD